MTNNPGVIINPVRTSSKHTFREALKKVLNDLYNKDASTNIHRIYDVLADQLKDLDISLKRALSDQWLSVQKRNETIQRSHSQFDLLNEEGAFHLSYIGFVPESSRTFQQVDLALGDQFIQLDTIPADEPKFSLFFKGKEVTNLIVNYEAATNRVFISDLEEAGAYVLNYVDKGRTLSRSEVIQLERNQQGDLEGKTVGSPVLFDTERVVIPSSAIGVLVRGEDYRINYQTGVIASIPNGRLELLNPEEIDISYRFNFRFDSLVKTAFHKQVFGETARAISPTEIEVQSEYVSEVFRVYNVTRNEELIPLTVSRNRITLEANNAIRIRVREEQRVNILRTLLDSGIVVRNFELQIPEGESRNAIQTVSNLIAKSSRIRLVQGGREQIPPRIILDVPLEARRITVTTGGVDAKKSNRTLQQGTDYVLTRTTPGKFSLFWLDAGLEKIGNSSVYAQLGLELSPREQTPRPQNRTFEFKARINAPSELYPIQGNTILLDDAYTYVDVGNNGDLRLKEEIAISTRNGTTRFLEGVDYSYDGINKVVTISPESPMRQESQVRIFFVGVYEYFTDYVATPDVIVVDYDWTRNSIDWSDSLKTYNIRLTRRVGPDDNVIKLAYHPDDPFDFPKIKIRSRRDPRITLRALAYDRAQRTLLVEAPQREDDFFVEYVGHKHVISPTVPYYVSYNYGGRDRALRNVWSPLLGLVETERRRFEEKQLNGNQFSVRLDYPPTDLEQIVIYLKGDTENEPATTITRFDPDTNTIFFTPLRQFGIYVVAYNTPNALTEDLRKFIIGMIEAFLTGPTKLGIQKMITTFTNIIPDIRLATELAFKLADEKFNEDPKRRSDHLNDTGFTSSNIDFVPARFNNGLESSVLMGSQLFAPSLTNVRTTEGTIEFLIGPKFNGDDGLTKYFIDIGIPGQYYKNRMAIYKNQRDYLVFETHDNTGKLWRVASDIGRKRTRLYRFLEKGTTSLELSSRPSFVTTDLNNDGQFDFFGAHKTEFIIRRVPGEPIDQGYGYSENVGYNGPLTPNTDIDILSPLNIAIHFQIPYNPNQVFQPVFDSITRKLQAVAQQVKASGGSLVIHTSTSYIEACLQYTNVLKALQDDGHEIGLYIDFPSYLIELSERQNYLQETVTAAKEVLQIDLTSSSGNPKDWDWSLHAKDQGLITIIGYVDPIFNEGFDNQSPIVRRVATSETRGLIDAEGGDLIFIPGATAVNFSSPITPMTIQQIESTLRRAITMNDVTQVASWYFTITPDDLTVDYLNEAALIGNWLVDTLSPLVELERVRWSNFTTTSELFSALEQWIDNLDAEKQLVTGRGAEVKPLTYDFDTNTISFEPAPSDGIYEFDYVGGWAAYEESEIFIAVVYKFRTDDESLPYYKLFINGELQEFVTFADFPEGEEG